VELAQLAARTPADRDRYVDLLRAFSITVVVLGHWLIAVVSKTEDRIAVSSAIGITKGLWLFTWFFQVMPLFFFVGGFSNSKTYLSLQGRGRSYGDFMRARAARLLKPVGIFLVAWIVVQFALHLLELGEGRIRPSTVQFGPLWFLVVYLAVVALTPVTLALHRRFGAWALGAMIVTVGALDAIRFHRWAQPIDLQQAPGDLPAIVWLNVAVVWIVVHQLGYLYADGTMVRRGRRLHLAMLCAGFTGLVVLTNVAGYPRSMVGTDIERVSNMNPPSLAIVCLALWLIGAAMLLRHRANAWLERPRPWMAVIAANSVIMTVFLWHLTAYLIAILLLHPLGLGGRGQTDLSWWVQRPIWVAVPALILAGFVAVFGRYERPNASSTGS
jgi:fucose 4-O-acetylase-like acetyltransferase